MADWQIARDLVSRYGLVVPFVPSEGYIKTSIKCYDAEVFTKECEAQGFKVTGRVGDIYLTKSGEPMIKVTVWY